MSTYTRVLSFVPLALCGVLTACSAKLVDLEVGSNQDELVQAARVDGIAPRFCDPTKSCKNIHIKGTFFDGVVAVALNKTTYLTNPTANIRIEGGDLVFDIPPGTALPTDWVTVGVYTSTSGRIGRMGMGTYLTEKDHFFRFLSDQQGFLPPGSALTADGEPRDALAITSYPGSHGDLAVLVPSQNEVVVFRGQDPAAGPRGFDSVNVQRLPTGRGPMAMTVGDFNKDGLSDILVSNFDGHSVSVFLSSTTGTYSTTTLTFPIPSPYVVLPTALAVADLNNDTYPDFAVGDWENCYVWYFVNNKSGGFATPTFTDLGGTSAGSIPFALAAGDFDKNGFQDIAVLGTNAMNPVPKPGPAHGLKGSMTMLLNGGNLSFTRSGMPVSGVSSMVSGDFNKDGFADLAFPLSSQLLLITAATGLVPGTVTPHPMASMPAAPTYIESADLYHHGAPLDVVVSGLSGPGFDPGDVLLVQGDGTGAFTLKQQLKTGIPHLAARAALVDSGDTNADLILLGAVSAHADWASGKLTTVMFSDGGVLNPSANIAANQPAERPLVMDLNGDGYPDVMTVDAINSGVAVFMNTKSGTLKPAVVYPVADIGSYLTGIAAADLNGDTFIDVVVADNSDGTVRMLPGDGKGGFGAAAIILATGSCAGPSAVAIADVVGSSQPDVIVACHESQNLIILPGTGTAGAVGARMLFDTKLATGSVALAVGDYDRSYSKADIVVVNDAADAAVLFKYDGMSKPVYTARIATGATPVAAQLVDVDSDGSLDLLVLNQKDATVSFLIGDGAGGFAPRSGAPSLATCSHPTTLAVPYLDQDNFQDLAVSCDPLGAASTLSMWYSLGADGLGQYTFAPLLHSVSKPVDGAVAFADFDHDFYSLDEPVIINKGASVVTVLSNLQVP